VTDFMDIVPKFPHLRNVKMQVMYRELGPTTWPPAPPKWKQDPDAEANFGYAPGTKTYINGSLVDSGKAKLAVTSSTPFPTAPRVPRWNGIIEVLPHYSDYEIVCREQGLDHLLQGVDSPSNVEQNGIRSVNSLNGAMGAMPFGYNVSTNEEMHRGPDSPATHMATCNGFPNGVDGIVQR
jgi:hypothetical protein